MDTDSIEKIFLVDLIVIMVKILKMKIEVIIIRLKGIATREDLLNPQWEVLIIMKIEQLKTNKSLMNLQ